MEALPIVDRKNHVCHVFLAIDDWQTLRPLGVGIMKCPHKRTKYIAKYNGKQRNLGFAGQKWVDCCESVL